MTDKIPSSGEMEDDKNAEKWAENIVFLGGLAGRCVIEFTVADQILKHTMGVGLSDIMPGQGYGAFFATLVTDYALRKAYHGIKDAITGPRGRDVPEAAQAEQKGSVWLVSGFPDGEVVAMDAKEFRKFEADLAKKGASLTKVVPDDDGTITTMHYRGGKLHREDGPAILVTKNGETVSETWLKDGLKVQKSQDATLQVRCEF